jgi:hypothetical protein
MPDETETQEAPKAIPAKAAPAAKAPAKPAFKLPANARITPQPARRAPAKPEVKKDPPREGTVERHLYDLEAAGKPLPRWKFAAAKAMNRWPNGAELSRDAFDAAIKKAETITVR